MVSLPTRPVGLARLRSAKLDLKLVLLCDGEGTEKRSNFRAGQRELGGIGEGVVMGLKKTKEKEKERKEKSIRKK